jgi:uncharacterized protein
MSIKLPDITGKQVWSAAGVICMFEVLALFLQTHTSFVPVLAATRSGQLVFLFFLLYRPIRSTHYATSWTAYLLTGVKTGLVWSFAFGAVVFSAGIAMLAAGTDPIAAIRPAAPETFFRLFLLTAVIIGPMAEELFFRGILYSFLRRSGMVAATGITTVLFALAHYSGGGFPLIQVTGGLLFAASFEYSKNLATPVTIHILGNLAIHTLAFVSEYPAFLHHIV